MLGKGLSAQDALAVWECTVRLGSSLLREGEPVKSGTEVSSVIDAVIGEELEAFLDRQARRTTLFLLLAVAGALAGLAGVAVSLGALPLPGSATPYAVGGVGALAVGLAGLIHVRRKDPPFEVARMNRLVRPFHVLPDAEGAIVADAREVLSPISFELDQVDDLDSIRSARDTVQDPALDRVLLPREANVEDSVHDALNRVRTQLSETESLDLEAPLFPGDHPVLPTLESLLPTFEDVPPVEAAQSIGLDEAEEVSRNLRELETLAFDTDAEDALQNLQTEGEEAVDALTDTQEDAIGALNGHIQEAGETLGVLSYNFYCPSCYEDDIESHLEVESRDGGGRSWACDTCRERFELDGQVIPKHRLKDELVEPIWDKLWIEKDDERRRIYERVEDQQEEFREREFEEKQRVIRDAWSRIKELRATIREIKTDARAGEGAVREIGDLLDRYDRIVQERKRQFYSDIEDAKDRIERETEQIIEETRNYQEEKIEKAEEQAEEKAEILKAEERKRHQEMIAAKEKIADEIEKNREERRRQHENEMIVESGHEVSMWEPIRKHQARKVQVSKDYREGGAD